MVVFSEAEDDAPRPAPPNDASAQVVQAAWEAMPLEDRLVLRAEYPRRSGQGRAIDAAQLRMTMVQYETRLVWAVNRVQEACSALCY